MSLGLGTDLVSPSPVYFRAHPAFAEPELYELFKAGDIWRTVPWPAPHGSAVGNGPGLTARRRERIVRRCRLGHAEILTAQPEPLEGSMPYTML